MAEQDGCLTQFQLKLLQKRLETELRPEYQRRIQIMLLTDAGSSQAQICAELKCSAETARYWMFMAQTGQAHQLDEHPIGRPRTTNEQYQNRLRELVQSSPREHGYAFKRWTGQWLSKHLAKELGIAVSERHVNRLLKSMGLSTRQAGGGAIAGQQNAKNVAIKIQDLQSSTSSEDLWDLNLLQMTTRG